MSIAVCPLCPFHCVVREGESGACGARGCRSGRMSPLTYGEVAVMHLDPTEKKPLFHFYPGTWILSAGGAGCNLHCTFCQNYEVSQNPIRGRKIKPSGLARMAMLKNSLGLCFTYTEPLVWLEMVMETAALVRQAGGRVALVTNGVIMPKYLRELVPLIDAVNIDIKAFNNDFYQTYTGGKLDWVLKSVEILAENKVHLEVTTLIIPGLNDDSEEIRGLAKYLRALDVPLAWHLTRYFPAYKANYPPTPEHLLRSLAAIGSENLPYVYLGNLRTGKTTYCPRCGENVIERNDRVIMKTVDGGCPKCGRQIWGQGLS